MHWPAFSVGITLLVGGLALAGVIHVAIGWIVALIGAVLAIGALFTGKEKEPSSRRVPVPIAQPLGRPRVRVEYSWRTGESKEKPFVFYNAGENEALQIEPQPFTEQGFTCAFQQINHLAPNGAERIERVPDVDGTGPVFANLIDMIALLVHQRVEEIRANNPPPEAHLPVENLDYLVRVAEQARANDRLPLLMRYADARGTRYATEYEVRFYMFAEVQEIDVTWIRDQ